jgi:cysteine desulfurase
LGARPEEVIFTGGGTEAINLALFGLAAGPPGTILLTRGEHPATLQTCRQLEARGWTLRFLELDSEGRILAETLDDHPWPAIKLATVLLAHNETGVIQDIAPLEGRCRTFRIPLHLDAVEAVGKIGVDFHRLQATALSLAGHKFHGPRGIGALLLHAGTVLSPRQFGGHQEGERRAGTESVALAAGMAVGLERWHAMQEERTGRLEALRDRLQEGLEARCRPTLVNGRAARRLPNTLNIAFPGVDGEPLLVALDLCGVACSLGSTCASGSTEPHPVLLAMGRPAQIAKSSVRFSVAIENTFDEIDEAIARIADCVARLRDTSIAGTITV